MKNQTLILGKTLVALASLSVSTAVITPTPALAQRRPGNRILSKSEVDTVIKRVERNSNSFRDLYEHSLSNGRLPGTQANDDLKAKIQHLDESLERLRSKFNKSQDWHTVQFEVSDVLDQARPVSRIMDRRPRIIPGLRTQWSKVKFELNTLARTFNLERLR